MNKLTHGLTVILAGYLSMNYSCPMNKDSLTRYAYYGYNALVPSNTKVTKV